MTKDSIGKLMESVKTVQSRGTGIALTKLEEKGEWFGRDISGGAF